MKIKNIIIGAVAALSFAACADDIAVGNSFLEKAPGGTTDADTVFASAELTRQYLTGIYSRQYYGLTFGSADGYPHCASGWVGKFDALTDCYQLHYKSTTVYNQYYGGTLTSSDDPLFAFTGEYTWEAIYSCFNFLEHIDAVPDMDDEEKAKLKAETYCLIATRYFDMFQFFGGLPLITQTYTGAEGTYEFPRATAAETVEYMIDYLDQAIATESLPWAYTGDEANSETGHWTKAGAMALKCRILQFAASPLLNNSVSYCGGTYEAEQQQLVWFGGYSDEYWTRFKTACEDFLTALNTNGYYALYEASGTRPEDYRLAFRHAYFDEASTEILHSVRVTTKNNSRYNWYYWATSVGRISYNPTQEYVEKFNWADGTPFDWEADSIAGRLDQMFLTGDTIDGSQYLQNITLTRDPRLYETVICNLLPGLLDWSTGEMSGDNYEMWRGGSDVLTAVANEEGTYATGYGCMKFTLGGLGSTQYSGLFLHWPTLRLSDIYLMYAEALIQVDGNCTEAIKWIDKVRARVGLGGLVACNPDKNFESDADALLEELLDERAREFGMENQRYFDLVRYKRSDVFSTPLHGLNIYRMVKQDDGTWVRSETMWRDGNRSDSTSLKHKSKPIQPSHFEYEKFQLKNRSRIWWSNFDNKWLLAPITQTEVNKGYGLIQNPGW